jgi:glucose-6-phosphate-specific signal transduction histidine kinase
MQADAGALVHTELPLRQPPAQPARAPARWPRLLLGVSAFWLVQGLIGIHSFHDLGVGLAHGTAMSVTSALLWIPLTWWALVSSDRFPVEPGRLHNLLVHALSSAGVCLFRAGAVVLLNPWVRWEARLPGFAELMVTSFHKNFFFYVVLVAAAHAFHYQRRSRERAALAAQLEAALARARLSALQSQLHPHFLFNALQSITELLHHDVQRADRMLVSLSRLLRQLLETDSRHEVELETELRTLQPYVELQQLRFGERLRVDIDVAPEALPLRVPHLILQPLVENAIRHGLAPRAERGSVWIRARRSGALLELQVADDGVGLPAQLREGLGLRNTRERLQQLYGNAYRFQLRGSQGAGCEATLHLPITAPGGSAGTEAA